MAKSVSNELGIDNLKKVFAFLLITAQMLTELLKNFSYGKALTLAFHIGENLGIVQIGRQALAEFRDLSVPESEELAAFIGVEFDLENDSLERRIEEGINILPEGYALLKQNIAFYEKIRNFVATWKTPENSNLDGLEKSLRKLDLNEIRRNVAIAA